MLHVCSLATVETEAARLEPKHLISILDPGWRVDTPPCVASEDHWRFEFHDISDPIPDHVPPEEEDIVRLLSFGEAWAGGSRTLIHCYAGISRSTAAAFILMCQLNHGREVEAAKTLRRNGRHAWPNRRMVAFADVLLGADGRMVAAVAALSMADFSTEGETISLPVRLQPRSP